MGLTDAEYRASEARRLLEEPLLKQGLAYLENGAIEEMLSINDAEPEDDRRRRMLADRVRVIRDLRSQLEMAIAEGLMG